MFPRIIEWILAKIFRERRLVQVILYPYTSCSVNCAHCSDKDRFTNETMTVDLIDKLLREAKWSWYQLSIIVMGGGEPLLSPEIVPIMEKLMGCPLVNLVKITTSGFDQLDSNESERFIEILQSPNLKKCSISHSFNLYHKSFGNRVKNAIEAMLAVHDRCVLKISMAVTQDDANRTLRKLEEVLQSLEVGETYVAFPGIIGKETYDDSVNKMHQRLLDLFNDEKESQIHENGYSKEMLLMLSPQLYGIRGEKKSMLVYVQPFPVEAIGSAEGFESHLFPTGACQSFLYFLTEPIHVVITPNGECFSDFNCFNVPHMLIGNFYHQRLSVLFKRKRKMIFEAYEEVAANFAHGESMCKIHQQYVRRNQGQ